MVLTALVLAPVLLGATTIYVYVDEDGVSHFTNVKPVGKKYDILLYGSDERSRGELLPDQSRFDELIWRFAGEQCVDPHLVKAIVKVESNFNPYAVSRKGAKGLMQIMPETQRLLGVRDPFDPLENLNAGIRYFRYLLDFFQANTELALAAYNAGPQRVLELGSVPAFEETREYVKRVISYYRRFKSR
jgi:soluble lytic murein transglycosylase